MKNSCQLFCFFFERKKKMFIELSITRSRLSWTKKNRTNITCCFFIFHQKKREREIFYFRKKNKTIFSLEREKKI